MCVFHQGRNVRTAIHGDDFTLLGEAKDLDWFRTQISSRYSVNFRGDEDQGGEMIRASGF